MSADRMQTGDADRPDDRLSAALRHAPDAALQAPPAVTARLRAAARQAVRPLPWWRRALATSPRRLGASGAFASVLLAGVLGLLWRGEPPPAVVDEAAPPAASVPTAVAPVPAPVAPPPAAPTPQQKPPRAAAPQVADTTAGADTAPQPAAEAAKALPSPTAPAAPAAPAADSRRLAAAPPDPAAWLAELDREVGPRWQPTTDAPPPLQRIGGAGIAFDHAGASDRVWRCDADAAAPRETPACRRATLPADAAERLRRSRPTAR